MTVYRNEAREERVVALAETNFPLALRLVLTLVIMRQRRIKQKDLVPLLPFGRSRLAAVLGADVSRLGVHSEDALEEGLLCVDEAITQLRGLGT